MQNSNVILNINKNRSATHKHMFLYILKNLWPEMMLRELNILWFHHIASTHTHIHTLLPNNTCAYISMHLGGTAIQQHDEAFDE